jgi:hypothetical protein
MRADRAAFVEFFACDELVLQPAEAEERINVFSQHRQGAALAGRPARRRPPNIPGVDVPAFQVPPELADADTVGVIYDEIDGLSFYNECKVLPRRVTPRAERPSSLRADSRLWPVRGRSPVWCCDGFPGRDEPWLVAYAGCRRVQPSIPIQAPEKSRLPPS